MRLGLVLFLLVFGQAAVAQSTPGCNATQTALVQTALGNAKGLTIKAAARVGDTAEYERWFGLYSPQNGEQVRATLKSIVTAIRSGAVIAQCDTMRDDGCMDGEYAWVYPHQPYKIHLCPSFFDLPPLVALRPGTSASNNGTREGSLVHEISHFNPVARTDDYCYTRRECAAMARRDPARAVDNADSYQYFTEDVTYYARQPVAGKSAP